MTDLVVLGLPWGEEVTVTLPVTVGHLRAESPIVPDVDLAPGDPGGCVSRHHCRLEWRGRELTVVDLGSLNGTIADGRPLRAHEPEAVGSGTVLSLGGVVLNLSVPGRPAAPSAATLTHERLPRPLSGDATLPRGTVTFLVTDVVGSTARMSELGEWSARQLMRRHDEVVQHHVIRHGGVVVKGRGDGLLAAFDSARAAVRCALGVQRLLSGPTGIPVRLGLHSGDSAVQDGDYQGRHVVIACRIADLADAGAVLASAITVELCRDLDEVVVTGERVVALKGLPGTVRVLGLASR